MEKICYLILGMHRSGTSVFAGCLSSLGFDSGKSMMKPLPENPKGFFENTILVDFNDQILRDIGGSWDNPFGCDFSMIVIDQYRKELREIIKREGFRNEIFIKDPRISLLGALYNVVLKDLEYKVHFIVVQRNKYEVAISLNKRSHMKMSVCLSLDRFYRLKINQFLTGKSFLIVNYDQILNNPTKVFSSVINRELNASEEANLIQFVDPDLKRNMLDVSNYKRIQWTLGGYLRYFFYKVYTLFKRRRAIF